MTGLQWPAAGVRAGPQDGQHLPGHAASPGAGPRLRGAVAEILERVAAQLADGAREQDVMPVIHSAVQVWAQQQATRGGPMLSPQERDDLAQAIYDQRYGLGPLEVYLRDADVENVDINGCDQVWVTYATGERVAAQPVAATDEDLATMIRKLAARGGQTAREFSAAAPLVSVAIGRGIRMTGTMAVTPRPCVSLRRHGYRDISLGRLADLGTLDQTLHAFLAAAVKARLNIIVTGGVNAGKTTLLRALASEIPEGERVATLESEYELYLHGSQRHPDVIAFEAREPNSEGVGGITLHQLIAHALRHNPHRVLVGEARNDEIMPMLEAMNTGQEGSMCTMHANSPEEAFDRILILGLRGGLALAERAIHILVGMAVDLIVHIRKRHDGRRNLRYVSEILEVMPPGDTERPSVNRIFVPEGPGGRALARHTPSPGLLRRIEAAGFDTRLLDHHKAMAGGWQ